MLAAPRYGDAEAFLSTDFLAVLGRLLPAMD
jgi:hypothetical protein